jgi:hypothetical protein
VSLDVLIALHRALPAHSLPELERAAARPGRIRQAARHVARCRSCRRRAWAENILCRRGAELAERIPRRRRTV